MNVERYVHIVMPVGSDPHFLQKKAALDLGVRRSGLQARFPDYLPNRPEFVLSELVKEICGAEAVVVDLSHERPSCYYELGIAEAVGKKVYLIAEVGTAIHQSAARLLVRYYNDLAELAQIVEKLLKEPIE